MSNNENDVVIIQLDRPRVVRFGFKAIKKMLASSNISMEDLQDGKFDMEDIEKFMFYGLQSDAKDNNEELTLDQMEDLLDKAKFSDVIEAFQQAISNSFGGFVEGN